MPAYDFLCEDCGSFDLILSFLEAGESAACPGCGSAARRVYSMPGVISTSRAREKIRLLNERGAEPRVNKGPATGNAAPKPSRVGGRPWQINH